MCYYYPAAHVCCPVVCQTKHWTTAHVRTLSCFQGMCWISIQMDLHLTILLLLFQFLGSSLTNRSGDMWEHLSCEYRVSIISSKSHHFYATNYNRNIRLQILHTRHGSVILCFIVVHLTASVMMLLPSLSQLSYQN